MNREIDFQLLVQISFYRTKIWDEEDSMVDRRKIKRYEVAIENRLKKLNADEQMREDIFETYCYADWTYKEQADRLRARGYVIVNNGENHQDKR